MTIGKRISDLRKGCSYSQEYVAEKIGVSRQAVSKWEQDQSAPDTYNLIAIAELFDVSVEFLATGKKNVPAKNQSPSDNSQEANKINSTKIVGFILLAVGLLSIILGVLFSELLSILGGYILVGGILCLAIKKNLCFIAMWTYIVIIFVPYLVLSDLWRNLFHIFNPAFYSGSINIAQLVICIFWIIFIFAIVVSILKVKNDKKSKEKN